MKKLQLIFICCLFFFSCTEKDRSKKSNSNLSADTINPVSDSNMHKSSDTVFYDVGVGIDSTFLGPDFAGGEDSLNKFIAANIKIPEQVKMFNLNGTVDFKLEINKKGRITKAILITPLRKCPDCSKEALRIIRKMPRWIPARQMNEDGTTKEILNGSTVVEIEFKN
ncbi:MAG: energy transducer TonB [Bacteroidia bacterium]